VDDDERKFLKALAVGAVILGGALVTGYVLDALIEENDEDEPPIARRKVRPRVPRKAIKNCPDCDREVTDTLICICGRVYCYYCGYGKDCSTCHFINDDHDRTE